MATTSPVEFFRQVRTEVNKVTWPSQKETVLTTVMVFAMVVVASVFFLFWDWVFSTGITLLFGFGGGR